MASTVFNTGTVITKEWLNDANALVYDVFNSATTAALARTALGLGSMALQSASAVAITGGTIAGITDLAVADGGTGASTAADARTNLGVPSTTEAILDTIFDASGDLLYATAADTPARLAIGTANQVLRVNAGATAPEWATPAPTLTAMTPQPSTSGTAINFTAIPSTAKRITVLISGVSLSGTDQLWIRLGTASGVETSGYLATSSGTSETVAFLMTLGNAAAAARGAYVFCLVDSSTNTWVGSGTHVGAAGTSYADAGTKSLAAVLDRIQVLPSGANTFDLGTINVFYE